MKTQHDYKTITELARELRKRMTPAEAKLWKEVRNRKLGGYKFTRQFPIAYGQVSGRVKYFIADFYCDAQKLVIELDGGIHEEQQEYDKWRDSEMTDMRLQVLRFKNEELENMDFVLTKILQFLKKN